MGIMSRKSCIFADNSDNFGASLSDVRLRPAVEGVGIGQRHQTVAVIYRGSGQEKFARKTKEQRPEATAPAP